MPDSTYELLNSHFAVSRETFERLKLYHDLLLKWQSRINLIGKDTIPDSWSRHFLDSLQLLPHIKTEPPVTIMDMGTGAGFPGLVLAIMGIGEVHLVESDGKKVTFLREVSRVTNTRVTIHHNRIENVILEKCDVIVSRACSNLNQLLHYASKNVSHETISLFHKGKNYSNEIDDAKINWSFDHEIFPSITDPNGVIVKLRNINRRSL